MLEKIVKNIELNSEKLFNIYRIIPEIIDENKYSVGAGKY